MCKDILDGVLVRSFSSAGHSCPVLVGRSRLSSSALSCTGCPLPFGLLRVALAGTQVCFGSVWVVEPPAARAHWPSLVQNSLRPLVHQAPLSLGLPRPFARKPIEAVQLPPWLLPGSLCPAGSIKCSVRTQRWRILPCGRRMREPDGKCCKGRGIFSKASQNCCVGAVGWVAALWQ